jgi:hypothetical protein
LIPLKEVFSLAFADLPDARLNFPAALLSDVRRHETGLATSHELDLLLESIVQLREDKDGDEKQKMEVEKEEGNGKKKTGAGGCFSTRFLWLTLRGVDPKAAPTDGSVPQPPLLPSFAVHRSRGLSVEAGGNVEGAFFTGDNSGVVVFANREPAFFFDSLQPVVVVGEEASGEAVNIDAKTAVCVHSNIIHGHHLDCRGGTTS